jgi:hypothetical protein
MEPREGGGALCFAFSALASSSFPISTHIFNCTQQSNTHASVIKAEKFALAPQPVLAVCCSL